MNSNVDSIFHIDSDMSVLNKHKNKIISNIITNIDVITALEIFYTSFNDYGHYHKKDTKDSLNE